MQPRPRTVIAVALSFALAAGALAADKPKKVDKDTTSRYPVPAGLKGFDGTLGGTIVSVQDHMRGFVLKVKEIVHSNARSTANNPKSAVGHEVEITPTVHQDKNGRWIPDEQELNYIKSLEKGQSIQIDVRNTDPDHLRIADLTKAEKQQADRERKGPEKKD